MIFQSGVVVWVDLEGCFLLHLVLGVKSQREFSESESVKRYAAPVATPL